MVNTSHQLRRRRKDAKRQVREGEAKRKKDALREEMGIRTRPALNRMKTGVDDEMDELEMMMAERLRGRFRPAEGAGYVWLEVERDGWEFLEDCLRAGVSLAPGAGFGEGFDRAMRLCYVACDLDTLSAGVDALNGVLER